MTGAPADPTAASLDVEVVAVRWRADDGDFAILVALTDDGDETILAGPLGHLHEGEALHVGGTWREHPRHGWQFAVRSTRLRPPVSDAPLLAYLASIKHVGAAGAAWLLDRHGAEVLDAVDRAPKAALSAVPGIGRKRIAGAVASWESKSGQRAVRLFLDEHGVPAADAARIVRSGAQIEDLRSNAYDLTNRSGIGFGTADSLARALGVDKDDPARIDAGLVYALNEAEQDGHCWLPRVELRDRAARLLGLPEHAVEARMATAVGTGQIEQHGELLADPRLAAVERRLAKRVGELLGAPPSLDIELPADPPAGVNAPTADQWAAIRAVAEHRISILTGLPGTGKTQTMQTLVELLGARKRAVQLCAPTGKAARRLAETTNAPATTIHRLLEYAPDQGFARDRDDPLTGIDVLVVDEASMLDVRLAAALLDAVDTRTHVLLVGDVDQLAPVGPGRVLDDLIAAGVIHYTRLTAIFRQAARSLIIRAAHAINRGEWPPTQAGAGDVRDFFLIEHADAPAVFAEVVSLAVRRLPAHYNLDAGAAVQVLAPMHRGPAGIDAFNEALRALLNPDGAAVNGTPLRLGDRVLQTKNDHEHQLMNGEMAVVVHHDADKERVMLACDDGRMLALPVSATATLRLAHCASVHKSQGSQFPAVVVALAAGHRVMLTRSLLYTAVTRAQRVCVVVAERGTLPVALRRLDARRRHTRLAELLGAG